MPTHRKIIISYTIIIVNENFFKVQKKLYNIVLFVRIKLHLHYRGVENNKQHKENIIQIKSKI